MKSITNIFEKYGWMVLILVIVLSLLECLLYSLILYFGREKWTCPLSLSKRYNPLEDVPFQDYQSNVLDLTRLNDSYLNRFHGDLKFICELLKMEYEEKTFKEINNL